MINLKHKIEDKVKIQWLQIWAYFGQSVSGVWFLVVLLTYLYLDMLISMHIL